MQKGLIGKVIGGIAVVAASGALALGGYTVFHGAGQGAVAAAYVAPVSQSVAAPAQDMTTATSIYDQQIAQAKAAADAAAAAQVAAQQAAAAAAAKAAAPKQTTTRSATTYAPGQAPKGTPLPFTKSSDPQNANGGDYADPGTFCASRSGSTIGGVPQCD